LTDVIGISANDAVSIRKSVRNAEGKMVVTRNTFFRIAGEGTPYEDLLKDLKGTNAIAVAFNEAPAVAKAIYDASEDLEPVELRGGLLDGKVITVDEIKALAKLPSREEMLGTLLATFNAPLSAFVRTMEQIRVKKEEGGESAPEEASAAPAAEEAPAAEAKPAEEAPAEEAKKTEE